MFKLVEEKYFGKLDQSYVSELKKKLRQNFKYSSLFLDADEQSAEVIACLQNLSITTAVTPVQGNELADKMSKATLNDTNDVKA